METIQYYRHIETREELFDSKELPTYIPLFHTYKLYERMIPNRIAPAIEQHLIKEHAGFRSGNACTSQLLNFTQHIEDGYEEGMITGTTCVDLSASYDTVNDRLLIKNYTTPRLTTNYVELSRTCCQIEDSMWSCTVSEADGEYKRTFYHRGVFSPPSYSTYTLTISQS